VGVTQSNSTIDDERHPNTWFGAARGARPNRNADEDSGDEDSASSSDMCSSNDDDSSSCESSHFNSSESPSHPVPPIDDLSLSPKAGGMKKPNIFDGGRMNKPKVQHSAAGIKKMTLIADESETLDIFNPDITTHEGRRICTMCLWVEMQYAVGQNSISASVSDCGRKLSVVLTKSEEWLTKEMFAATNNATNGSVLGEGYEVFIRELKKKHKGSAVTRKMVFAIPFVAESELFALDQEVGGFSATISAHPSTGLHALAVTITVREKEIENEADRTVHAQHRIFSLSRPQPHGRPAPQATSQQHQFGFGVGYNSGMNQGHHHYHSGFGAGGQHQSGGFNGGPPTQEHFRPGTSAQQPFQGEPAQQQQSAFGMQEQHQQQQRQRQFMRDQRQQPNPGVGGIRRSLDETYVVGDVSVASAAAPDDLSI
jgi:hypothetical protein